MMPIMPTPRAIRTPRPAIRSATEPMPGWRRALGGTNNFDARTDMPATALQTRSSGGGVLTSAADEADALRVLHDQHARAVWAYVVRLTNGDSARADDVVQETMLRAWRNPQ